MRENPADKIRAKERESDAYKLYGADDSTMWEFLMTYGQKANIPQLKESVYDLIQMMTQKTAGQRKDDPKAYINVAMELDMTINSIVIEAVALVLSGKLDEMEEAENGQDD